MIVYLLTNFALININAYSLTQAAAFGSSKSEVRGRALQAGHDVAVQYRELLQMVMHNLNRPSPEAKTQLGNISRKIAQCVTDLVSQLSLFFNL